MTPNNKTKKPTMFEAAKKVMGIMEDLTARHLDIINQADILDTGRKEVPTPRQLAQIFRNDAAIEVIRSASKKDETLFRKINE